MTLSVRVRIQLCSRSLRVRRFMSMRHVPIAAFLAAAILAAGATNISARQDQSQNKNEAQVQMTVSVEARHGMEVPPITREDVVVMEGDDHDTVTKWIPAQG